MDKLAQAAVTNAPPSVDVAEVTVAVDEQFGLTGEYSPLVSERDQNFRLQTPDGSQFVVKVTSATEARIVSDFYIAVLLHLEKKLAASVPRIVRTRTGQTAGRIEHDGTTYVLRAVSYLEGEQLASVVMDADIVSDFGAKLAELDKALQGFSHAGERPELLWDLQRVLALRELVHHIDDPSVAGPVADAIDDFERLVEPWLKFLRSQVIHGDANPENVLLDASGRTVSGFIDFSDIVKAPLVVDVAIAAAYLRPGGADALALIAPFVAAYCTVTLLQDDELELLFDLVRARLATTITILYWRLGAREEDDPYRQKTLELEGGAIRFLNALDDLGRAAFIERLGVEISRT